MASQKSVIHGGEYLLLPPAPPLRQPFPPIEAASLKNSGDTPPKAATRESGDSLDASLKAQLAE